MGRYEETTKDSCLSDLVVGLATGGLSLLLGDSPTYETRITDKETGEVGVGHGSSKREARANAWGDLNDKR